MGGVYQTMSSQISKNEKFHPKLATKLIFSAGPQLRLGTTHSKLSIPPGYKNESRR